jgi:hypothetical protein
MLISPHQSLWIGLLVFEMGILLGGSFVDDMLVGWLSKI